MKGGYSDCFIFNFLPQPALQPGEQVLATAYSWAVSGESPPSERFFWALPPEYMGAVF